MIYAVALLFIAGLTLGAGGMNWWRETLFKAEEAKRIAVEAKLAEETAKAIRDAENRLTDMQAAFEAGESKAKTIEKTVYIKGQDYVRTVQAFSDPRCVVDAAGVQLVNGEIARVRAAAAALGLLLPVPSPGTDSGGQAHDGGSVPAVSGSPVPAAGVHRAPEESGGAGTVSGQSVQRPSKPTPIK